MWNKKLIVGDLWVLNSEEGKCLTGPAVVESTIVSYGAETYDAVSGLVAWSHHETVSTWRGLVLGLRLDEEGNVFSST